MATDPAVTTVGGVPTGDTGGMADSSLDAKQRMIITAAKLFQRQGYNATGLKQVVEEAKAPRGSIYHHFPGGKEEMGVQAIEVAASAMTRVVAKVADRSKDPGDTVRKLGKALSRWLEESDYLEGCPVSTVTLEAAPTSEPLTAAVRAAYREWIAHIVQSLRDHGVPRHQADKLGMTAVASIEGALLLCRAEQSTAPMRTVCGQLAEMIDTHLAAVNAGAAAD